MNNKRLSKCECRAGNYCAYHAHQAAIEAGRLAAERQALARLVLEDKLSQQWSNQAERLHPGYTG